MPPQQPSHAHTLDRALPSTDAWSEVLPDADVRDAMVRICALADVNPPTARGRRMLAFSGVATLWVEAALLLGVAAGLT